MALKDKLKVPLYDVTCPSGKTFSFRPFLGKEEKLLLIAMESDDAKVIFDTVLQILQNCVGDVSNVKVDSLPLFDIEFLFLNLRARSIGEKVTLRYKCQGKVANTTTQQTDSCGTISEYVVDLLAIKPSFGPGHTKYIALTDSIGVTLKYPSFKSFSQLVRKELPAGEAFEFVLDCIDSINDANEITYTKDVSRQELIEFVDLLSHDQIAKMDQFFTTMPKIETTVAFNCPKCGAKENIVVSGLDNFFV